MPKPQSAQGGRAGQRTKAELDRRKIAQIDDLVTDQLLRALQDDPNFIKELPDSTKATFLAGRLPKARPLDEDLQSQALSLSSALEQLPDITNLPEKCAALSIRCRMQQEEIDSLKYFNKKLRDKKKGWKVGEITKLLWRVRNSVVNYYEEKSAACLTEEQVQKWVEDAFDKEGIPRADQPANL